MKRNLNSDLLEDFNYEDFEDEEVSTSSYSLKLIFENFLIPQIQKDMEKINIDEKKNNYINFINEKIKFLLSETEDEKTKKDLKNNFNSILIFINQLMEEKYNYNFNEKYEQTLEDIIDKNKLIFVEGIYKFCVLDRLDNTIFFIVKSIIDNKKDIINKYKKNIDKKKNFALASFRNILKNFDDTIILYCIEDIIDEIISMEVSPKEFFDSLESDKDSEVSFEIIKKIINEDNENFMKSYFSFLKNEDNFISFSGLVKMFVTEQLPKK